jgi:DNA-binding transcriptional LysR family regulator
MDIRNIKRFLALNEHGSFSKAADYLAISQPSLTREIQKMEDEIGQKLFVRLPTGIGLTPTGEIYRESFQKILNEIEHAKLSAQRLTSEVSGRIKIAVHPIVGQTLAPLLEKQIQKDRSIDVDYLFMTSREAMQEVSEYRTDFAVVASTFSHKDIKKLKLWNERIELFSLSGKEEKVIFANRNMINAERILKKFNKIPIRWVNDYGVLRKILLNGQCMGLLPNTLVNREDSLVSIKHFPPIFEISLIFRTDLEKTGAHHWIIDTLKRECQNR